MVTNKFKEPKIEIRRAGCPLNWDPTPNLLQQTCCSVSASVLTALFQRCVQPGRAGGRQPISGTPVWGCRPLALPGGLGRVTDIQHGPGCSDWHPGADCSERSSWPLPRLTRPLAHPMPNHQI